MTKQAQSSVPAAVPARSESVGPSSNGILTAVLPPLGAGLLLMAIALAFGARSGRAMARDTPQSNFETHSAESDGELWRTEFADADMPEFDPSWHPELMRKVYLEHRLRSFREAAPGPNQLRRAQQLELLSLSVILDHAGLGEVHGEDIRVHLNERFPGERVFFLNETVYRYDTAEFPETLLLEQALHGQGHPDRCSSLDHEVSEELQLAIEARCQEALGFLDSYVHTER